MVTAALVKRITPGQAADTKELVALLDAVAVPRPGGRGRHRKRLEHLTADKADGSKARHHRRAYRASNSTPSPTRSTTCSGYSATPTRATRPSCTAGSAFG
ncbi:hypothetical protein [Krasilnikovia sp. MM14-A1004]|uniref:hypothetical protein n=1 Tax=Krasilnikovia sp. MM14-A1004 TaxID=3373541 RepID=UPI00399C8BD9